MDLKLPVANRGVVQALVEYACELLTNGKPDAAKVVLHRALAMDDMNHIAMGNLGALHYGRGELIQAEAMLLRAITLCPEWASHWGNLAIVHSAMRLTERAAEDFARCVELSPDGSPDRLGAFWNRSLMRLRDGDWENAWDDYEARIMRKAGTDEYPPLPCRRWTGEPLHGKRLYVHPEQGMGDRILMSRYLAEVKRRWPTCEVIMCLHGGLLDLFWEFRDLVTFVPPGVPWPAEIDYGCYMASLMGVLSPTVADIPKDPGLISLRVQRQPASRRIDLRQPKMGLKVGFAWTGSPSMGRNAERTIPLAQMLRLAEAPWVNLYSFQVGEAAAEIDALGAQHLVENLSQPCLDLGPVTAGAAMVEMDVMVTVCTSTAHLAGALGVPTIALLCQDHYWVWMGDEVSRWYPSVRLIRQPRPGDWGPVLEQVARDLEGLWRAKGAE